MLLVMAAMAAVQVVLALHHSLWPDETFSLAMATGHSLEHPAREAKPELGDFVESPEPVSVAEIRRYGEHRDPAASFGQVLRAVKLSDTSPPLYYLVLSVWTRVFGTSDLGLRSLSIVMSLACVPLLWSIGYRLAGEIAAWLAVVLFAIAPASLYYSSEGRMYSMLWFCVLAVMWATLELHRARSGKAAAIWVVASAAGLFTHYYFVFPWCASLAFLLITPGEDRRWQLVLRTVVVLLVAATWYVQLPEVLSRWRITQDWVTYKPSSYTLVRVFRDSVTQYFSGNGHNLWERHHRLDLLALLVFGLAGLALLSRTRARLLTGGWLLIWLWFFAAATGPIVADLLRHTYIAENPRYNSAALLAACLLGAWALSSLRMKGCVVAALVIAACWGFDVWSIGKLRGRSGQDLRDAARELSAVAGSEDVVLIHSIPSGAMGFARYFSSSAKMAVWVGQLRQRTVPESLEPLIKARHRVFLVKFHEVGEPAPEEDWLRSNAVVHNQRARGSVSMVEFRPRDGATF